MNKEKIVNKHFHRAILGYDVEEVDAFLDEVIRDMEHTEQELNVARLRIRILLGELESHGLIKAKPEDAKAGGAGEATPGADE